MARDSIRGTLADAIGYGTGLVFVVVVVVCSLFYVLMFLNGLVFLMFLMFFGVLIAPRTNN